MSDDDDLWDDEDVPSLADVDEDNPGNFVDDEASVAKDHDESEDGSYAKVDEASPDEEEDGQESGHDSYDEEDEASSGQEEDDDNDDEEGEEEEEGNDRQESGDGSNALKRLMQSSKEQPKKKIKHKRIEFIDDEAELSGDDEVSDDELEQSDDDQFDPTIVDHDAKELSSGEEEDIRRLYHKQLDTEDRRAVLLLQEQLEENDIDIGQRRRRKFRWQNRELMENSLKRHYDPDDEDSVDDDEMIEYTEVRLRRPTAESLLFGNTKLRCTTVPHADYDEDMFSDDEEEEEDEPLVLRRGKNNRSPRAGLASNEDSSSLFMHPIPSTSAGADGNLNKYIFRDKELVQALSTKEVIVNTREEKDRIIQRELKKVIQSKSIFDQLY